MNATVKDVMSTNVITVHADATFKDIATQLHEQRVSAFPVVDGDGRVIGVVSEADLLTKEALGTARPGPVHGLMRHREHSKMTALTAADLMSEPPITIGPDEPATSAARLMYNTRVKRLPVVTGDGTLVGIVSRVDVLSVYSRPDEEIGHEIREDLILGTYLCDPNAYTITVKDGVVTMEGTPETALVGHDIVDSVRHTEGVVAVRDRLSYPPEARYRANALI